MRGNGSREEGLSHPRQGDVRPGGGRPSHRYRCGGEHPHHGGGEHPHRGGGEPTERSARPPVRGHPGDIDGQRPGVEKRKERETEERGGEKKDGYICLRSVGEQKEGRLLAGDADQKGQGYTQWVATEGAHTQVTEEVTDPVNERKNTHGLWN